MQLNYVNTMLKVKILQQGQQISFLEAVARWQGGVIRGQENRIGQLQGQVKGLQNQVASLQYTIYQLKHRPSGGSSGDGGGAGGGGGMGPKAAEAGRCYRWVAHLERSSQELERTTLAMAHGVT